MQPEDIYGQPCECPDCYQAGISGETPRRDPRSGKMMHGYDLKRWLDARAEFFRKSRGTPYEGVVKQ